MCAHTVACFVFPRGCACVMGLYYTPCFSSESPYTIIMRLHNTNVCFQVEQLRAAQSRAAVYTNRSGSARMSGKQHSGAGQEPCQAAGSLPLELVES